MPAYSQAPQEQAFQSRQHDVRVAARVAKGLDAGPAALFLVAALAHSNTENERVVVAVLV